MGKKNKKSKKTARKPKDDEKKKQKPLVTMADLQAMSDSEDSDMPPEEEWDADAKALKKMIEEGAFDKAMKSYQGEKDEESVEEADLDDDASDDEEYDEKQEDNPDAEEDQIGNDDDDNDDEEEEEEEDASAHSDEEEEEDGESEEEEKEESEEEAPDEPDSTAAAFGKPQHRKDSLADKKEEEEKDSDNEESEDEQSGDDDDEEKETTQANENTNTKAIRVVTESLVAFRKSMPWAESFAIVPHTTSPFAPGVEEPLDIHDDLKREVAFYDMALEAALEARKKCEEAKIPFSRPDDFFAEMVKTDEHMARIKDRLIFETKKMEAVAQRKSNKEQNLRSKEAQSNKFAEKAKRKKEHFKAVQEWAQTAASQRGGAVNEKADEAFLRRMNKGPSKKRQAADRKYGYGGKRGRFKKTDPSALNDMSGYNKRGNFEGGKKRTASSSASGANRPGKRARQAKSRR